jgi:ferredoxin
VYIGHRIQSSRWVLQIGAVQRGCVNYRELATMKVWIDQDLCTGDGLCEEIAPDVFTLLDDGLAYVVEAGKVFSDPGGAEGLANFADSQLDAVIESAEECPGECIFIEAE